LWISLVNDTSPTSATTANAEKVSTSPHHTHAIGSLMLPVQNPIVMHSAQPNRLPETSHQKQIDRVLILFLPDGHSPNLSSFLFVPVYNGERAPDYADRSREVFSLVLRGAGTD
jgi:hypothetical protein